MRNRRARPLIAFALIISLISAAEASEILRLGLATEHQSLDPHYSRTSPNQNTAMHIFESLASFDERLQPIPSLATNWRQVDTLTWEISLRPDVYFHDGSEFDAKDVISTVNRIPNVENSPASFLSFIGNVSSIEAINSLTLRITTKRPDPAIMNTFGQVFILPSELGTEIESSRFDNGEAAIGTGPYRFVSWTPNENLELRAYKDHWRATPDFEHVIIRYIPNDASRVATLFAGDLDAVDKLPPSVVHVAETRGNVSVTEAISGRVIYLHLDSNREITPFVKDTDGMEIKNPLRDPRVRKALSLLIDREAIADRIMYGYAAPTAQLVPDEFRGYSPSIPTPSYDPIRANELLTEAGFPNGFSVTLHGPNDRYVNDSKIVQAIAQLFARNGIETVVQAMPKNIYFGAASRQQFSVFLVGFGSTSGEALAALSLLVGSYDRTTGFGSFNRGRYSNPFVDEKIRLASASSSSDDRERFLREASELALLEDQALIPLYFEYLIWGHSSTIEYSASPAERTLAQNFRRSQRPALEK